MQVTTRTRRRIWAARPAPAASTHAYKAFLSYSHATDTATAERLHHALGWFARPFIRGRAFRIFLDRANLSANPDLWNTLIGALRQSEYYVFLASPAAARSPWVRMELDYWLKERDPARMLFVLTDGTLAWDRESRDFDWSRTDAFPEAFSGRFREEPLWVDLTWARGIDRLDPKDRRFEDAVATLGAPLHGKDKDELYGEHLRLRRRARRQWGAAFAVLVVLTLVAIGFATAFHFSRQTAIARAEVADSRRLAAIAVAEMDRRLDRALILGVEAVRRSETFEARGALSQALNTRPEIQSFLHKSADEGDFEKVSFSPDGGRVAASFVDPDGTGGVVVWDAVDHKRALGSPLRVPEGQVDALSFTADGKGLVAQVNAPPDGQVVTVVQVPFMPGPDSRDATPPGEPSGPAVPAPPIANPELSYGPMLEPPSPVAPKVPSPPAPTARLLPPLWSFATPPPRPSTREEQLIHWDAATGSRRTSVPPGPPLKAVAGPPGSPREQAATSPDGKLVASPFKSDSNSPYDEQKGGLILTEETARARQVRRFLDAPRKFVMSVAFSPDGRAIAGGLLGEGVRLWDLRDGRISEWPLDVPRVVTQTVTFSPDGKILAAGSGIDGVPDDQVPSGGVALFDAVGRRKIGERRLEIPYGEVTSVAFSPDGKILAVGYRYRRSIATTRGGKSLLEGNLSPGGSGVILWDASGRRITPKPLEVSEGDVSTLAFSSDGEDLLVGVGFPTKDHIWVWDVKKLERAEEPLPLPGGTLRSVAISPDDSAIAAGVGEIDDGGGVAVWILSGELEGQQRVLNVPEGRVRGIAYSPDGKVLAAGYVLIGPAFVAGGGVVFWDTTNYRRLGSKPLLVAEGVTGGLSFSRDGKSLAVGTSGGVAVCSAFDLEFDVRAASKVANRNLSWEEWREFFPDTPYRRTFPELPDGEGVAEAARGRSPARD